MNCTKVIIFASAIAQLSCFTIKSMENSTNNTVTRYDSERLERMYKRISTDNTRIGEIGTLIIGDLIGDSYYETTKKTFETHEYIKTSEKTTEKSVTITYTYNPLILKGSCNNDDKPLAKAILLMLKNKFDPEHETNNLNDYFFTLKDKDQGYEQVDYCTSALYNENEDAVYYIARFFNKKTVLHTLETLKNNK